MLLRCCATAQASPRARPLATTSLAPVLSHYQGRSRPSQPHRLTNVACAPPLDSPIAGRCHSLQHQGRRSLSLWRWDASLPRLATPLAAIDIPPMSLSRAAPRPALLAPCHAYVEPLAHLIHTSLALLLAARTPPSHRSPWEPRRAPLYCSLHASVPPPPVQPYYHSPRDPVRHGGASRGHTQARPLTPLPHHQSPLKRLCRQAATAITTGAMASRPRAMPRLAASSHGRTLVPRWARGPQSQPLASPRRELAEPKPILCSIPIEKMQSV
jgi:hypothetical protein